MSERTFESRPAVRQSTPLLVGLVGPSSSGKTYSALRLAAGVQRVSGGTVYMIDTEANRGLHYADEFRFHHLPFSAPFGPTDYLAAINHCVGKGARVIVIDSLSHEHVGPGGVLEMHEAEVERLSRGDAGKAERVKMLAWARPKAERRRLINSILQINCNFIFCFRAKEKLKIARGKEPEPLGFMPEAGEEYVYEMVLKLLLLPGANGVPTLQSEFPGERLMIKVPGQFRDLFSEPRQLSEDTGERLARWAAGTPAAPDTTGMLAAYAACRDRETLGSLEAQRADLWPKLSAADKRRVKAASEDAAKRLDAEPAQPPAGHLPGIDDPELDVMGTIGK